MRNVSLLLCALIGLAGCAEHDLRIVYADGSAGCVDSSVTHDMEMAQPPCIAAKGLSGIPIICTDFTSPQTLIDLKGMGWDFTTQCPAGWAISNANLQINSFSTFASSCIFTTRPLTAGEYQKYSSFTLSVVQTVDLNVMKQGAYVYLGLDVPPQQIWYTTGTYPQTVTTLQIAKPVLPNGGGTNTYQPLFKITSSTMVGTSNLGWQIGSIAVMGNP